MNRLLTLDPLRDGAIGRVRVSIPLIIAFLLLISLGAAVYLVLGGYGAQNDTYRLLATWQNVILNGDYIPSRQPGHFIPELVIGFSAAVAGSIGSNLVSLLLSILSLTLLYLLVKDKLGVLPTMVVITFIATNPYWILISSSSRDEIYAAFFLLLGIYLFRKQWWGVACLSLAMATSSRIEYGPLCLFTAVWFGFDTNRVNYITILNNAICYLAFTGLLFLPAFVSHHFTMNFLTGAMSPYGDFFGFFARFSHKIMRLFGLLGFVCLIWVVARGFFRPLHEKPLHEVFEDRFNIFLLVALSYFLVMFLIKPGKVTYAMPILVVTPLLLMNWRKPVRGFLVCSCLFVVYWFASPDFLAIERKPAFANDSHALGARFSPQLKTGVLLREARWRDPYQEQYFNLFQLRDPREVLRSDAVAERRSGFRQIWNAEEFEKPSIVDPRNGK